MTPPASSAVADARPLLTVPGIGGSGPGHWQTRWERDPAARRVEQDDWDAPVFAAWAGRLEVEARAAGPGAILVAHSIGCLLVAGWAGGGAPVAGALLVAVPDPAGPAFPAEAIGFGAVPMGRLPFPAIVVSSEDDPYDPDGFGAHCAAAWGAEHVAIGRAGHINADSGLGDWPDGKDILRRLPI